MTRILICWFAVLTASLAFGQEVGVDEDLAADRQAPENGASQPIPDVVARFTSRAGAQLDADLDGGGDFSFYRVQAAVGLNTRLADRLRLDTALAYEFDSYEFDGGGSLAGLDPWDDVHGFRVRALFSYSIDRQWSVFGGPFVTWAGEEGADFSEAFTAGGLAGFRYQRDRDHAIGFGFAAQSQLEDNTAFFPIILLDWKLNDRWKLQNSDYDLGSSGGAGIELTYLPSHAWEFGVGAQYSTRRFRLDDEGVAPGGVGDHDALPLYAAARWNPNRRVQLTGFVAVIAWGQLELQDSNGLTIAEEDNDPAFAFGGTLRLRF